MATDEQTPGPLPEGFEPMSDRHIAKNRRVAVAIGENNVKRMTWKQASKEQIARGWASSMTITMESMVEHNDSNMVAGFINVAALVLTYALDSVRFERARAEAAEQRAEALEREVAQLRNDRKALASMWLMTLPPGPLATVLPADPESARLLGGGLIDVTGEDIDTAGLIVYMRDLLARMLAEAKPAGEVSDG